MGPRGVRVSPSRRSPTSAIEVRVERLEGSVRELHEDYREMHTAIAKHGESLSGLGELMGSVNAQLAELVRIGERQLAQREAIDRAFGQIGKQDGRVSNLERRVGGLEARGEVVHAAGSGLVAIIVRVVATGIVAAVATFIALYASRGVA